MAPALVQLPRTRNSVSAPRPTYSSFRGLLDRFLTLFTQTFVLPSNNPTGHASALPSAAATPSSASLVLLNALLHYRHVYAYPLPVSFPAPHPAPRCHLDGSQRSDFVALAAALRVPCHCLAVMLPAATCAQRVADREEHPGGVKVGRQGGRVRRGQSRHGGRGQGCYGSGCYTPFG